MKATARCPLVVAGLSGLLLLDAMRAGAVALQPYLSGLSSPVFLTHAGDGTDRRFVVEQGGRIRVVQPGSISPTTFLDITTKVLSGGERGLLGLAFHPQYASNRRFFVDYTRSGDGATVIAEYQASAGDPNVADPTETVLLTIAQPFSNHNGGMLAFGPDGFLYIGMGDGGSANDPGNRAQNIDELLGKILRLDVDTPNGAVPYSAPSDNPFAGTTPGADEIYAVGLRNPWRFSFDRTTGALYVGDVGQGAREEVDIVTNGGNYGWRVFEGTLCTNLDSAQCSAGGFTAPILDYRHAGGRCSITGGYVYRGTGGSLPSGAYVYGDYCTGEIFTYQGGAQSLLLDTALSISSFGEDQEGELYVVSLGGTIDRLVAGSSLPTATPSPTRTPTPSVTSAPPATGTPTALRCGDGLVGNGEQCDDGNSISGDGCSAFCQSELIPDRFPRATDCMQEWLTAPIPPLNRHGRPLARLECTDDDPACDFGEPGDEACTFHVALCLNVAEHRFDCIPSDVGAIQLRRPNPNRPRDAVDTANRDAIEAALAGLGGTVHGRCNNRGSSNYRKPCDVDAECDTVAGSGDGRCKGRMIFFDPAVTALNTCTGFAAIRVPLRQRASGAATARKRLTLSATPSDDPATGARRRGDADSVLLRCRPKP